MSVLGCLMFHRESFKNVAQRPSLKRAFALILSITTVAAIANFNYNQLPLLMFIGVFVWWLLSSILIHGVTKLIKKTGTFTGLLTLTGYASSPMLIQHVLRLVDSFVATDSKLWGRLPISSDPWINSISNMVVDTFTIFRLWSIGLYVIAVSENYKISMAKSAAVAVGAYVIMILFFGSLP